ncbi:MAG TPA: hypothetical protein VIG24_11555 [Acidimicrobiia bacterium]
MRRAVEVAFELASGGEARLVPWMMERRKAGRSLRRIAEELEQRTGIGVSHETVRQWMIEG